MTKRDHDAHYNFYFKDSSVKRRLQDIARQKGTTLTGLIGMGLAEVTPLKSDQIVTQPSGRFGVAGADPKTWLCETRLAQALIEYVVREKISRPELLRRLGYAPTSNSVWDTLNKEMYPDTLRAHRIAKLLDLTPEKVALMSRAEPTKAARRGRT